MSDERTPASDEGAWPAGVSFAALRRLEDVEKFVRSFNDPEDIDLLWEVMAWFNHADPTYVWALLQECHTTQEDDLGAELLWERSGTGCGYGASRRSAVGDYPADRFNDWPYPRPTPVDPVGVYNRPGHPGGYQGR